jgi:hypothetical protein
MGDCIYTKGIKGGDHDENSGPSMVEREGKVNEELIGVRL